MDADSKLPLIEEFGPGIVRITRGREFPSWSFDLKSKERAPSGLTFLAKENEVFLNEPDGRTFLDIEISKLAVGGSFRVFPNAHFYGLGDKTGYLDKKGFDYINWNTDEWRKHDDTFKSLYKSINFFIVREGNLNFGIFFGNPFKTHYDFCKSDKTLCSFHSEKGPFDVYVFYGPSIKDVVSKYTKFIGRMPLPQKWTLGFVQSRFSYYNDKEIRDLMANFEKYNLPLDCIHFDINYMDGFRVFTTDKKSFPDMKGTVSFLKDHDVHSVAIIDPAIKVDDHYSVYLSGIKNKVFCTLDGQLYHNSVWAGDSLYPDFMNPKTRYWWGQNIKYYTDLGFDGIWCDMNEPASFDGLLPDTVKFNDGTRDAYYDEVHNSYGYMMDVATNKGLRKWRPNERPFVLTRACTNGGERYATTWTGDNFSVFPHIHLGLVQIMNLGLSGFPFSGFDIGGFSDDCNPELFARFMELGAFMPFCRNHSTCSCIRQEPWSFGKETLDITRKWLKVRYRLIPYFYDLFAKYQAYGIPLVRPLAYEFEDERRLDTIDDEFMLGPSILIAPIMEEGATRRTVVIPKGNWYRYNDKKLFEGGMSYSVEAKLGQVPMFVREGAIIPMSPKGSIRTKNWDELHLEIFPGKGQYVHYQDDGKSFDYLKGAYNCYLIEHDGESVNVKMSKSGYKGVYKRIEAEYLGKSFEIKP